MAAISPLEWLGIAMATRAKEAGERAKAKSAEEQALVNERLTKYGGDMSAFQKEWEYGYGPQQTLSQQQAQQFYDYWMDLPKTLEGAQKEQKGLGKASVLPAVSPYDEARALAAAERERSYKSPYGPTFTSADTAETRALAQPRRPATSATAPRARSLSRTGTVRFS
jgi:hypothetical protein